MGSKMKLMIKCDISNCMFNAKVSVLKNGGRLKKIRVCAASEQEYQNRPPCPPGCGERSWFEKQEFITVGRK